MSEKEITNSTIKITFTKDEIQEYKEAFDIFDKKNTGIISTKDIMKIKKIFSYPIAGEDIEKMIKEIDTSGNGKFDFIKFITLMKKQINFIEEKDENIVLESLKDEYLGNKRKRETLNNSENFKYDCDYQLLNNTNSFIEEKSVKNEEVIINSEDIEKNICTNINSKSKNKSIKFDNNNIIRFIVNNDGTVENLNTKVTINLTSEIKKENEKKKNIVINRNSYKNNYRKKNNNKKENKEKNNRKKIIKLKKIKNIKKNLCKKNIIYIYKKDLPKNLIEQVEYKNNQYFTPIKKRNNEEHYLSNENFIPLTKELLSEQISIKEKSLPFHKQKSNYSSKYISDFDFINLSNISLGENSFVSEFSLDFSNKPSFFPSCGIKSRFDRSPMINIKKHKKEFISNSTKKFLERIKERLNNKGVDVNDKKNLDKSSLSKYQLASLQKIVNNDFYGSENIIEGHSKLCINDNNKYLYNNKNGNNNNNDKNKTIKKISYNKIENIITIEETEDDKTNEDISKIQEKQNKPSIQILNSFELEYKKNNNDEKIIKKVIEIPYLIIIDKSNLIKEELKNISPKKKPKKKYIYNKHDSTKIDIKEKKNQSNLENIELEYYFDNNPKENTYNLQNVILIRKKPIIIETLSDTE